MLENFTILGLVILFTIFTISCLNFGKKKLKSMHYYSWCPSAHTWHYNFQCKCSGSYNNHGIYTDFQTYIGSQRMVNKTYLNATISILPLAVSCALNEPTLKSVNTLLTAAPAQFGRLTPCHQTEPDRLQVIYIFFPIS